MDLQTMTYLVVGASFDYAEMQFKQTQELGVIDSTRGIANPGQQEEENSLRGTTRTASLFITDTYALTKNLHLTGSARYNMSRVTAVCQKPLNVDVNHVVFVQVLLEVSRLADFQSGEHCFRVAAAAVISCEHIRCI